MLIMYIYQSITECTSLNSQSNNINKHFISYKIKQGGMDLNDKIHTKMVLKIEDNKKNMWFSKEEGNKTNISAGHIYIYIYPYISHPEYFKVRNSQICIKGHLRIKTTL